MVQRGAAAAGSSRGKIREEHPDELSLLIKRFPGIEADSEWSRRPIWQKVPATKWTENNAFVEVAGNSGRVHERRSVYTRLLLSPRTKKIQGDYAEDLRKIGDRKSQIRTDRRPSNSKFKSVCLFSLAGISEMMYEN